MKKGKKFYCISEEQAEVVRDALKFYKILTGVTPTSDKDMELYNKIEGIMEILNRDLSKEVKDEHSD